MSLWMIAWRSMRQRALSSWLTGLSMALGVALVVSVLVIHAVVEDSFRTSAAGYDLIVGAKGGKLQLVLNTVYHLSTPIENIPYSYYKEFTQDATHVGRFARNVETAIPFCLGDNYEGFRVVGTTPDLFKLQYARGKEYAFSEGRKFIHKNFFEAVIGSVVARSTGLSVGDQFQPTHGVSDEEVGHKHDAFTIVGVLEPTGTPNDRALFINMEGFYLLDKHSLDEPRPPEDHEGEEHEADEPAADRHGDDEHGDEEHGDEAHDKEHADEPGPHKGHVHHAHSHHEPLPEELREVTAILVKTRADNMLAAITLPTTINEGSVAQAVHPSAEIYRLFDSLIGNLRLILLVLALLIVAVAGIGIMVSMYNSMSERRREIAIMRSLGASRGTVLAVVLMESILLALGGGVCGLVLGHGLIGLLSPIIAAQTGVSIGVLQFNQYELVLIPGLVGLASLAGFLPGVTAYKTDVARALSATG